MTRFNNKIFLECVTHDRTNVVHKFLYTIGKGHLEIFYNAKDFDIQINDTIINVELDANNCCLDFCKNICEIFKLRCQLIWTDYQTIGQIRIHNTEIVFNEELNYWYGLYLYNIDHFWETYNDLFENIGTSFEEFINSCGLENISTKDLYTIREQWNYHYSLGFLTNRLEKM
jgi:hypothetical protein